MTNDEKPGDMQRPWSEEAEIEEIVRGFVALQARSAAEQGRPLRRATHAKGLCARAVFEVLDVAEGRDPALAARLAQGIYARPGCYPATVRFANADPGVNADWQPDVRGLSFYVEYAPSATGAESGHIARQDYSLQSAPTLPINDVHAFRVFAKVLGAQSQTTALASLSFRDQLIFAQTMNAVTAQTRQPVRAFQQLRYWSNVAFRHGAKDIVKYCASPDAANPARALDLRNRNPNALHDELIRHLNEDAAMSAFDFGVQFLDMDNMSYQGKRQDASFWIENASVEWPEDQAPFHTVARLRLVPRSQLSAEACEAMYIDVNTHSTADSSPVGGVNRVRWYAEIASRRARMGSG